MRILKSPEFREETVNALMDICSTKSVNKAIELNVPCDYAEKVTGITPTCPENAVFDGCATNCQLRTCDDFLVEKECSDNGYIVGGCVCNEGMD